MEGAPQVAEVEEPVCRKPLLTRKVRSKWENPAETYARKRELKRIVKQKRHAKQERLAKHRALEAAFPEAKPTDPLPEAQPRPQARQAEAVEEAQEQRAHAIAAQVVPQERFQEPKGEPPRHETLGFARVPFDLLSLESIDPFYLDIREGPILYAEQDRRRQRTIFSAWTDLVNTKAASNARLTNLVQATAAGCSIISHFDTFP